MFSLDFDYPISTIDIKTLVSRILLLTPSIALRAWLILKSLSPIPITHCTEKE